MELIDCDDYRWDEYLNLCQPNQQDIYFTSQYCKLYETDESKAKLFVLKQDKFIGLYPFLIKRIQGYHKDNLYDIETPYGYGGPITNTEDEGFNRLFEKRFQQFCCESNIIAEFIRFHPFMNNHHLFKENIWVTCNRKTVVVNVEKDIEEIWNNDISSKNRNVIRKAIKNELTVDFTNDYEPFIEIYNKTMAKVRASDNYIFDKAYYNQIKANKNCKLMVVKKNNEIIAGGIFMGLGEYFHYHLSGSQKEFLNFSPNNLMIWEAIKFAHNNGFKKFHLGGGASDNENDSLFKFKNSFSKDICNFYIGKRIHNEYEYNCLIEQWKKKTGEKPNILLSYRC